MSVLPIHIPAGSRALIIGAGGGFDFLCGLPIVLELEARGIAAVIGNLSFTRLSEVRGGKWYSDSLLRIDAGAENITGGYFPELHLARWFWQVRQQQTPIWCLQPVGAVPTLENYNRIIAEEHIDTVICIDGGVDGIFRGDEFDLGTPSMDAASVIAASLCSARSKYYACTAFGIEGAESGVSHAQVLNRMADLVQKDAMLGVGMVLKNTSIGRDFMDAASFIHQRMETRQHSTIVSAILAAMRGDYGFTTVNAKTQERKLWISPLTALYWYFRVEDVARLKLFYEQARGTQTVAEIGEAIEQVRRERGVRGREEIPV